MRKTLSDKDIATIVGIIDVWEKKLTYDRLIEKIESRLHRRFSRQALFSHTRIRDAFDARKSSLRNGSSRKQVKSVELQIALDRIERLEAEVKRFTNENDALLAQFVRWAYNANSKGLTLDFLNQPLPPVDRGRTQIKPCNGRTDLQGHPHPKRNLSDVNVVRKGQGSISDHS